MRALLSLPLLVMLLAGCVVREDSRGTFHLGLNVSATTSRVGDPVTLTVHAADRDATPTAAAATTLRIVDGGGTVTQPQPTDALGNARASLSANVAGVVTVQLTALADHLWDGIAATASVTFAQDSTSETGGAGHTAAFSFTGLTKVFQGQRTSFSVRAVDANNVLTPGYTGVVTFTTSDSTAVLPGNVSFAASDHGVHAVASALTFKHVGAQTLTATDVAESGIAGSANVTVSSLRASHLVFENAAVANQCLTLPGLDNQVHAPLGIAPCAFHNDQVFALGSDGALRVAGYCVEVPSGVYADGTAVQLNECNGAAEQGWALAGNMLYATGDAQYCLDSGAPPTGAPFVRACNSLTASQQWAPHVVSTTYALLNATANRAANIPGATFADGRHVQGYVYNGSSAQHFRFGNDGTLSIAPPNAGVSYCIGALGGVYGPGTKLGIYTCNGSAMQAWSQVGRTLRPQSASNLCFDLQSSAPLGTDITVETCSGAASQQLLLQSISTHYTLHEKANPNLCVTTPNTDTAGGAVTVETCARRIQQVLRQDPFSDDDSIVFRYPGGTKVFDCGPEPINVSQPINLSALATSPNTAQWMQAPLGDGFMFVAENAPGLVMDVNSVTPSVPLIVNAHSGAATQVFYKWARSLTFASNAAPTQCLGLAASPNVGTPVVLQPCTGEPHQQWVWMPDNGALQNSGLCLDVVGGALAPGAALGLAACTASSQQAWNNNATFGTTTKWFNGAVSSYCMDTNGLTAGSALLVKPCVAASTQFFVMQP